MRLTVIFKTDICILIKTFVNAVKKHDAQRFCDGPVCEQRF